MNTEPIVIPINGDASDFIADSSRVNGSLSSIEGNTKKTSMSVTDLRSSFQLAADAARIAGEVWQNTAGVAVDLANDVRSLRDVTGQSAEESSRLIQVLDDYKITVEDADKATKKLAKEGMEFNIQTLAKLSDEFLKLNPGVERTTFLYDNFGKSGDRFAEIMLQGGDAILAANDAISKNLVLSDKQLQAARDYEKALDEWNDSILAIKVSIGNELLPNMTSIIKLQEDGTRAAELAKQDGVDLISANRQLRDEYLNRARAEREANSATEDSSSAMDIAAQSAEDYKKQLEEVSQANADLIKGAIDITRENENFAEKQQAVIDKIAETRAEGEKLYPWEHEKILENQQALEDLGQQYFDNLEDFKAAQEEKLAMMAIEKIAMSDGVAGYSEAEYEKARAILETQNVATAAAFEQQQAMETLTTAVADGQITVEEYAGIWKEASADGVISISEVTAAIENVPSGKTVTFDIVTNGAPPNLDTSTAAMNAPVGTHRNSNATGGEFMIPMSYGNEGFMMGGGDTASGGEILRITPRGEDPNKAVVEAIYATRITADDIARAVVIAAQQVSK